MITQGRNSGAAPWWVVAFGLTIGSARFPRPKPMETRLHRVRRFALSVNGREFIDTSACRRHPGLRSSRPVCGVPGLQPALPSRLRLRRRRPGRGSLRRLPVLRRTWLSPPGADAATVRVNPIIPFAYFGGPGFPTAECRNYFGTVGPLATNPPVVKVERTPDEADPNNRDGCFTGALPDPEEAFAPFVTRAALVGSDSQAATQTHPAAPARTPKSPRGAPMPRTMSRIPWG